MVHSGRNYSLFFFQDKIRTEATRSQQWPITVLAEAVMNIVRDAMLTDASGGMGRRH